MMFVYVQQHPLMLASLPNRITFIYFFIAPWFQQKIFEELFVMDEFDAENFQNSNSCLHERFWSLLSQDFKYEINK